MIWLLVRKESGIYAATRIAQASEGKILKVFFDKGSWMVPPGLPDVIVRWGITQEFPYVLPDHVKVINTPEGIYNAYRKIRGRRLMAHADVPVPKTWFDLAEAKLPFIARPGTHMYGRNFFVVRTEQQRSQLNPGKGWYYSEIYPKTQEYRVFVGSGRVLATVERYLKPGELRSNSVITNIPMSAPLDIMQRPYGKEIAEISINACRAISLDTGAVDIMVAPDHRMPVTVCEVNSMPGVKEDWAVKMYVDYLLNI